MTPNETLIYQLGQKINLTRKGSYSDVTGPELTSLLDMTIDATNLYLDELELEADWLWVRENNYDLGTVFSAGEDSFDLPDEVLRVVRSPYRDLTITNTAGEVVSTFRFVAPNQIHDPSERTKQQDRVTVVNGTIIFSRALNDNEVGGTAAVDVVLSMPRLSRDDVSILDMVNPLQLIVLGVAKNLSLPDLVRGNISPSLLQRYNDILKKAKDMNDESTELDITIRDDMSYIQGIY